MWQHSIFEEKLKAGLVLQESEVKSIRSGSASIKESFGLIHDGEVFLLNSYIAPYTAAKRFNHETKREINKLIGKINVRGYTLVPTTIYFVNGKAKLELMLAKSKKNDKREYIKRKEVKREMLSDAF